MVAAEKSEYKGTDEDPYFEFRKWHSRLWVEILIKDGYDVIIYIFVTTCPFALVLVDGWSGMVFSFDPTGRTLERGKCELMNGLEDRYPDNLFSYSFLLAYLTWTELSIFYIYEFHILSHYNQNRIPLFFFPLLFPSSFSLILTWTSFFPENCLPTASGTIFVHHRDTGAQLIGFMSRHLMGTG